MKLHLIQDSEYPDYNIEIILVHAKKKKNPIDDLDRTCKACEGCYKWGGIIQHV